MSRRRGKSRGARGARAFAFALAAWFGTTAASVLLLRWVDPPTSMVMVDYRLSATRVEPRLRQRWVDWGAIAPSMKLAVIAGEDQRFKDHFGFDVKEIAASLDDAMDGGRLRGASTITQQVAKNLFLWQGQSWLRKGLEAYFTVLLEVLWPKARILEVYLNIAELGHGVYGVGAAADRFFGKPPARLTAWESARLAAVLPNPRRMRADAPSAYVRGRQLWILRQMNALGGNDYLRQL